MTAQRKHGNVSMSIDITPIPSDQTLPTPVSPSAAPPVGQRPVEASDGETGSRAATDSGASPPATQPYSVRVGHHEVAVEAECIDDAIAQARRQLCDELPRLWDVIAGLDDVRFEVERQEASQSDELGSRQS
jgi:hypothetical protein